MATIVECYVNSWKLLFRFSRCLQFFLFFFKIIESLNNYKTEIDYIIIWTANFYTMSA